MHKFGEYRTGGFIFAGYRDQCPNGEYWMPLLRFESKYPGWHDRRKRMDENVRLRSWERILAKRRKEQRDLFIAAHPIQKRARRIFASNEERIQATKQKQAEKNRKNWAKGAVARAKAEEERKRITAERVAARDAEKAKTLEQRLAVIEMSKAKRKALESLRKPRVHLTEEQRKVCRRDEKRNYKHRRRAIIRNQEAKATPKQIRSAMFKAKGKCHYCRNKSKLTIDHVIPLARGGSHTLDNIVFACHGCNSKKRDLPAHEFGREHGLLIV